MDFQSDSSNEPLWSVVRGLCRRAGMADDDIDTAGIYSQYSGVSALALSTLSSSRSALDILATAYYFETRLSDKLYFRYREFAPNSVVTIPYEDLGFVSLGGQEADALPLVVASGLETNTAVNVTYSNILDDQQTDSQMSQALTGTHSAAKVVSLPLLLHPRDAKQIADAIVREKVFSRLTATIRVGLKYAGVEPSDIIQVTDKSRVVMVGEVPTVVPGKTYRLRVLSRMDSGSIIELECVQDSALTLATSTSSTDQSYYPESAQIPKCMTLMFPLDLPMLRDVDDYPGVYLACGVDDPMYGASPWGSWNSATIYETSETNSSAVPINWGTNGPATGKVPSGLLVDNTHALLNASKSGVENFEELAIIVRVDNPGTVPEGVTFERLTLNATLNMLVTGGEIIRFRSAVLYSPTVYILSGLIRGCYGTGHRMTTHANNEVLVFLEPTMKFSKLQTSLLGTTRHYKSITTGLQTAEAVSTRAQASITLTGNTLRPYAPVGLTNIPDEANGTHSCSWSRRTRLSSRWVGTTGWLTPLGETSESYQVEVYSSSAYSTVLATFTVSVPNFTLTLAQQTTLFGGVQSRVYIRVYQMSSVVGRGHALQGSMFFS